MKKISAMITAVIFLSAYALAYGAETTDPQEVIIVQNSEGQYIVTITDALVDSSGNIGFVILSIGGEENGKKEVAVPTVGFSTKGDGKVVLDVGKEKLAAAPEFKSSDLSDPNFAETVYRYFGLMPSWREGMPGGETKSK